MYLNLACGSKLIQSSKWINIDFSSPLSSVRKCNILKNLPFKDNSFEFIYSSQFVEHLTYSQLQHVLKECYRILKPNGIIRIVTPDLEELTKEYLLRLSNIKNDYSSFNEIDKYNWIRLEIFDQILREHPSGEMFSFMQTSRPETINYISNRLGYSSSSNKASRYQQKPSIISRIINKLARELRVNFVKLLPKPYRVGLFRQSGEIHKFLHDEYTLASVLSDTNFISPTKQRHHSSYFGLWDENNLDIIDGMLDGPYSLIMEARKH